MNLSEYAKYDATGLAALVRDRQVTPKELADLAMQGIDLVDTRLNAFVEVYPDRTETPYLDGLPEGPLRGIPTLKKDLSFAEAGHLIEMGSLLTKGMVADTDSTAFERLRGAGAVFLGRTTTPEFGLTGTTESRISGITRNPWDLDRTPGGSSGGSAAMVAAGVVPVETASDGGGSTRTPAAYCGLVGLKQSRGRIPAGPGRSEGNNGLSAAFVVTRSARDCALCLDIMNGPAEGDPYGIALPVRPYREELDQPLPKMRIAYMDSAWIESPVSESSRAALHAVLKVLEAEGHIIEEATPAIGIEAFIMATTVVACANLARDIDGFAERLGRKPDKTTLQTTTLACYQYGKTISATSLLDALAVFNGINRCVGKFFGSYDLLVTPNNLYPAPLIEEYYRCDPAGPLTAEGWQAQVFENDSYLATFNTTGSPAISLPVFETDDGVPVGVQFASRFGDEATLVRLAAFLERAMPWAGRTPPVHVSK